MAETLVAPTVKGTAIVSRVGKRHIVGKGAGWLAASNDPSAGSPGRAVAPQAAAPAAVPTSAATEAGLPVSERARARAE